MQRLFSFQTKNILPAFLMCFFSWGNTAYSQAVNIDSLLLEYKYNPDVDLRTYDQLFITLHLDYMEELVLVGEDLLKRSLRHQNMSGLHRAADAFGVYFTSKGFFNQAYKVLNRSLQFYERNENWSYLMKSYGYLGELFLAWDNPQQAVYWYNKLYVLSKDHPQEQVHYSAINNLSQAYFSSKQYDLGIYTLKQNGAFLEFMNSENKSIYYNLYGNYHLQQEDFDTAMHYYEKSIAFAELSSDFRSISTGLANLAICAFYMEKDNALELFERSYRFALKSKSVERICVSLYNLASWYIENETLEDALDLFNESYSVALKNNSYRNMFDALDQIAEIYRQQQTWIKLDSIQGIISELKSQQYNEFINLTNDSDLLESAFELKSNRNTYINTVAKEQQKFNQTLLFTLLLLISVQFVIILVLARKVRVQHRENA